MLANPAVSEARFDRDRLAGAVDRVTTIMELVETLADDLCLHGIDETRVSDGLCALDNARGALVADLADASRVADELADAETAAWLRAEFFEVHGFYPECEQ